MAIWVLVALFVLVASPSAWAGDLHAAEAVVLGAYRFAPVQPGEFEVRRTPRLEARIPTYREILENETDRWLVDDRDKLDVTLDLLEQGRGIAALDAAAQIARRVRRILSPTENIRLRLKIDPLDREYRAAVRVRF